MWWPQAAVLAGLPRYRAQYDGAWEDELNIRTHCPAHRGVLADGTAVPPGRLAAVGPDQLLDAAYPSTAELPQLLLAGEADPLADRGAILKALRDDLTPAITVETSTW